MRQYLDAKREHKDAIVFFRMGDFYEMFYEDALTASRVLELTLTSRSKDATGSPIPMCGIPAHAGDGYLSRLVKRGFRVAVCEQINDPTQVKGTKGLVHREVVRVVTPGTLTDAADLDAKQPAFLMALAWNEKGYGAALVDLSTGEFTAAEYAGPGSGQVIADEVEVLRPREVIVSVDVDLSAGLPEVNGAQLRITKVDGWAFGLDHAKKLLHEQLHAASLDGFGMEGHPVATMAAGALLHYLQDTQKVNLEHVRTIVYRSRAEHVFLDPATFSHLEVFESADGGSTTALLTEIDRTVTPMGARQLRAWLQRPSNVLERVQDRLDAVEELAFRNTERAKLQELLKGVHDLERLVARVALRRAGPRDLVGLKRSLTMVPRARALLSDLQAPLIRSRLAQLDDVADIREAVESTLIDDPPELVRDGGFIRDGHDAELDGLRSISRNAKQHIAEMETVERERTGIATLKVRYNRVFGYYIEVSKSKLHAVPDDYQRRQTVASGERFVTPALKEYEEKALGADDRIMEREQALFEGLSQQVAIEAPRIQDTAAALAGLDVLSGLAETATLLNYTKPQMHDGDELHIVDGRHPVVEQHCPDRFVPNDTLLNGTSQQVVILTGPNMGGKSTYLRQVAVITLLAHVGSFVPAKRAKIPIADRIFARVGASDNIARGQSTFMLEMQETAKILHMATSRSLVILDEIGRGTATFDGLSIAWAVAEHLATNPQARPKTLFATHYHELTDLADSVPGVVNYHVVAREWQDDIVFLRKVELGRSDRSYGIQVARLAGLPATTIQRAKDILAGLESDELSRGGRPSLSAQLGEPSDHTLQMGLFRATKASDTDLVERIRAIDIDRLTPLQALSLLAELQQNLDHSKS
jgi:DNA mismatch repair protein MutS